MTLHYVHDKYIQFIKWQSHISKYFCSSQNIFLVASAQAKNWNHIIFKWQNFKVLQAMYFQSHHYRKQFFIFLFFSFHLKKSISLGNSYTWRLAKPYINKEYSEQIWSSQCLPFTCKTECELNKKHYLHKELPNYPNPEKFKVLPIVS